MKNLTDFYYTLQQVVKWFSNESNALRDRNHRFAAVAAIRYALKLIPVIDFTFKLNSTIYLGEMWLSEDEIFIEGYIEPVTYDGYHLSEQRANGYFSFYEDKDEIYFTDEDNYDHFGEQYLCPISDIHFLYSRKLI